MLKKKKILILAPVLIIILCILTVIFLSGNRRTYKSAESVEELLLGVEYKGTTEEIRIFPRGGEKDPQSADYYYFVPAECSGRKIHFLNVPKEGITFDGRTVTNKDDLTGDTDLFTKNHTISFNEQEISVHFLSSGNIGAMFINTESGSLEQIHADKNYKEKGYLSAVNKDGGTEYDGEIESIKCRGVSSFLYCDKKSYTVNLSKSCALLGMEKGKKWVLQANYYDDSRIKNKLAYDYARENSSVAASESEFVDLYINGEYQGNYLVCKHPEDIVKMDGNNDLSRSNKAVNSEEDLKNAKSILSEDGSLKGFDLKSPTDITGGYVIELNGDPEAECSFTTALGKYYEVVYPQNATYEEVEYIRGYMNEAEEAFLAEDGINPATKKSYTEYIDVTSWAEKYVMDELFADPDKTVSNRSVYFYKYSDTVDSHLYAGPAWDYDVAFGESSWVKDNVYLDYPNSTAGEGLLYGEYLLSKEEMKKEMKAYFSDVAKVYVEDSVSAKIRKTAKEISPSLEMESIRWPETMGRYISKQANWDYTVWFLTERKDFLEDVWINEEIYHQVIFLDADGNVCEKYKIKHGEPITRIPTVVSYGGIFAGWRFTEKDWLLTEGMPVMEDVTFRSVWLDAELLTGNIEALSGMDLSQVDLETLKKYVRIMEESRETEDRDE